MIPLMWILLRLRLAEEMQKNPSEVRGFFPLLPLEIRGFQAEETMQQTGWTKTHVRRVCNCCQVLQDNYSWSKARWRHLLSKDVPEGSLLGYGIYRDKLIIEEYMIWTLLTQKLPKNKMCKLQKQTILMLEGLRQFLVSECWVRDRTHAGRSPDSRGSAANDSSFFFPHFF